MSNDNVTFVDFNTGERDDSQDEFSDDATEVFAEAPEDFDDLLYGDGGLHVDPDRLPFGWNITDYVDWDSFDYGD